MIIEGIPSLAAMLSTPASGLLETMSAMRTEGSFRKKSMIFCVFDPVPEAKMISVLVAKEIQLWIKSTGQKAKYMLCLL